MKMYILVTIEFKASVKANTDNDVQMFRVGVTRLKQIKASLQ